MAVDQNNGQVDPSIPENYEHLLEDYSQFAPPAADEVVQGTVLGITAKDVIIDFGYKSEGIVPIEQFQSPTGEVTVKRGDVVDVMIDRSEQVEGYVLLSHTKAARLRIWDDLERASSDQLILSGRVLGRVKGGLAVDVGVKAFMPGSQADPRPVHNLDSLIGQDIPVKIIKLNRRRGNVVVSRKLAVEEEINPIHILGSAHQKRAAEAKRSRGATNAQTGVATVAKRDGMQSAVALQNLAGMLVRFGHQALDASSFLFWLDHPHDQLCVIHHGRDRFVSDLGLLYFSHLAVVARGFRCLTVGANRVAHGASQDLQRHAVLLALHGGGGMTQQVAGHANSFARSIDQHHAV